MLKYLKIIAVLAFFAVTPAHAADPAPATDAKSSVTVNSDDLKKLITTLESDTGRKDFIDNLKTLEQSQAKAAEDKPVEETIAPITKTLGVDTFTNRAIEKYQNFLTRNDLKSSTVGKIVITVVILLVGGLITFVLRRGATKFLYWFDRAVAWLDLPATRMRTYARVLRAVVTVGLMGLMLYTLTLIWDFDSDKNPFETHWFRTGIGLAINVGFVLVMATMAWEAINALLQVTFKRVDGTNSARAKTILPIVRNILFLIFAVLFSLMLLSEIGINILPLLAGAGVIGVAIGFGAQTMVKDFLSGFTLILEDVMRVGDNVQINEFGGVIEKITLRKVQIRGGNGTVFTIPFSAISIIQNKTKDFSSYDFTFTAPFDVDIEKVFAALRAVGDDMKKDATFGPKILDAIDIWGVDGQDENGIIIKGRIRTVAGEQFGVQREFNRRKITAFEKAGLPNAAMPRSFQISQVIAPPPVQPQPASKKDVTNTPNP